MSEGPRLILTPKKGTPEWYKWIVQKLAQDASKVIADECKHDSSLWVALKMTAENQVQRALILLLVEQGVFKKVEEIVIPKD